MTMHERRTRTMRQLHEALGDQLAEFPEIGDLPVEVTDQDGIFTAVLLTADLAGGSVLVCSSESFWHEPFVVVERVSALRGVAEALARLGARVRRISADLMWGKSPRRAALLCTCGRGLPHDGEHCRPRELEEK